MVSWYNDCEKWNKESLLWFMQALVQFQELKEQNVCIFGIGFWSKFPIKMPP